MRQMKVYKKVERQVAERGERDIQCIILQRAGGPNDSVMPRYYMGTGKTEAWALQEAFRACREHGDFEPVLVNPPARRPAR